jgi:CheY-like chemotaxis protein
LLIVDDETNIRLTLSMYLSALGCGVDTVGSGNEALDKIRNRVYDLLLIDIKKMSKMSGLELYEKLHAERPELAKRFVFMTGMSGQETDNIIKTTDVPLLQKPLAQKDMLEFFSQLQPRFSMQLTGRGIN